MSRSDGRAPVRITFKVQQQTHSIKRAKRAHGQAAVCCNLLLGRPLALLHRSLILNHGVPSASNQTIRPYTDMLLHDMGPELADQRPDFLADGQEWRTPPLWGIGLSQFVVSGSGFLHDGRARNFAEAILWHGGEAMPAREAFRLLPLNQRNVLMKFLGSL